MAELKSQAEKDKLNTLVDTYGREAVNKSIQTYWQDAFAEQLGKTNTETINQAEPTQTITEVETTPEETTPEVKVNTPVVNEVKTETVKEDTPVVKSNTETTAPEVKSETDEVWLPETIDQWKTRGSDMNTLEEMIETKYGTVAENVNGTLNAEINWIKYQWNIDEAWNPIKTKVQEESKTSNDYFTDMQMGVTETNPEIKNSVDYKAAQNRKLNLDKYSAMNANELQIVMGNWELLTWSQSYNDLKATNPTLLKEAEDLYKLNAINTGNTDVSSKKTITQSISDYITNLMSPNEVKDFSAIVTSNEEIKSLNTSLTEAELKKNELIDQINNAEEEVKTDLGWKTVSKSYFNYLVSEKTIWLTRLANLELAKISSIGWQIENITSDLKYDYEQGKANELADMQKMQFAYELYQDQQAANQTTETEAPNVERIGTDSEWNPIYWTYNQTTKKYEPITFQTTPTDIQEEQNKIINEAINVWTWNVTQNYWATSPVSADNVTLADWTVWTPWIDIDGQIWDAIKSYTDGTVVALHEVNESGWFGRRVIVKDEDWRLHVYNHLQGSNVNVWDEVKRWDTIASMWNTGTVIKWTWWDWSHLDYRVSDNWSFALNGGNWIDPTQFMWEQVDEVKTEFDKASIPQFTNYLQTWKTWASATEIWVIEDQFGSIEEFKRQAENYNNSENWPRQKELDKIIKLQEQLEWFISEDVESELDNSIGTIQQAWTPWNARKREDYLANLDNFLSWLTLNTLISAKADWATFGALSNEELKMLQNSASELNQLFVRPWDKDYGSTFIKWTKANFVKKVNKLVDTYQETIDKKRKLMGKTAKSTWNTITSASWNTYTY